MQQPSSLFFFGNSSPQRLDLVFKNQANGVAEKPQHFVNDLLRTEFHKQAPSFL